MKKPTLLTIPDCSGLISACQDYMDYIVSPKYNDDKVDDYEHAIFETALQTVFGDKVFDYVNWLSDERGRAWKAEREVEALKEARRVAESMGLKIVPKEEDKS